jgi:hypothetical protein
MSSSVGVGGDDDREWTISWWQEGSALRSGIAGSQPVRGRVVVVPRSRLERVEAERDKLREDLETLYERAGRLLKEGDPE